MEQTLKDGPALVLEVSVLFQLLRADGFWAALPAGSDDLREIGQLAADKAVGVAMGFECTSCSSLAAALAPIRDALGRRLASVQATQPALLDPVILWIAKKRGYRPRPIRLIYRDEVGSARTLNL